MLTLKPDLLTLLLTLLIPVAVAIVTKASLPSKWKAVLTIILAALVTLLQQARGPEGTAVLSAVVMFQWAITTAIAIAAYLGFYKPVVNINQTVVPEVGVGPKAPNA